MKPTVLTFVALAAMINGCGHETPQALNDGTENMTNTSFIIGETDFGIEVSESSFEIDSTDPAKPLLNIEIRGNEAIFDKISADDASKWSWASYAPHFYIRDFPAKPGTEKSAVTATATLDDIDEYELAIYMMEHSDIDDVKIQVTGDKMVDVTGRVDLFGETHDFAIRWRK